jgi:hypothetical protein
LENGEIGRLGFSVAKVKKPLAAASAFTRSGHRIILDEDGSYVVNKKTKKVIKVREVNGVFKFRAWLVPPNPDEKHSAPKEIQDRMIAAIQKERRHIKEPRKSEDEEWQAVRQEYEEITRKANHQSGFTRRARKP